MLADRKGKFETDIPFDKEYTLLFVCPFMLPVAVDVVTLEVALGEQLLYEVPLRMRMYHRFQGMSEAESRKSIGVIRKTSEGEESFSFIPDDKVIARLKPICQESEEREKAGEQPVPSEVFSLPKEDVARSNVSAGESNDDISSKESIDEPANEMISKEEDSSTPDREARASDRYEEVATSKEEERQRMVSNDEQLTNATARSQSEGDNYVQDSKRLKAALRDSMSESAIDLAEARIKKQERVAIPSSEVEIIGRPATTAMKPKLIKHTMDNGIILREERVIVERDGERKTYRKATYDWLLFEATYITCDDLEISQEEYDEVKRMVGI